MSWSMEIASSLPAHIFTYVSSKHMEQQLSVMHTGRLNHQSATPQEGGSQLGCLQTIRIVRHPANLSCVVSTTDAWSLVLESVCAAGAG